MIKISEERYDELLEAELELIALQHAGVSDWEGYDYALELLEDMRDGEDD